MSRRVLVTGGSRGIGAAIAAKLAADGLCVAVNFRQRQAMVFHTPPNLNRRYTQRKCVSHFRDNADKDKCPDIALPAIGPDMLPVPR